MTLWEQYDAIVSEIAVTGITERGENINGWIAERRAAADALRDTLLASSSQTVEEARQRIRAMGVTSMSSLDRDQAIEDLIAAVRAEPRASSSGQGWQPIDTAPKGTRLWCFDIIEGYYEAVLIEVQEFISVGHSRTVWRWHNKSANRYSKPTHWMPLPAPPSSGQGRQADAQTGSPQPTNDPNPSV